MTEDALALSKHVASMKSSFVDFVSRLVQIESPTDRPETQRAVQALLGEALSDLGFAVEILRGGSGNGGRTGAESGGQLLARPAGMAKGAPAQLLLGHTDTVWPMGTLERMPVRLDDGRLYGPGALDMKGGLAMMIFALRALRALGREPEVAPVLFVNSDEEVGSPDSKARVAELAGEAQRTLVLEPAMGPRGLLKTARKGVGRFEVMLEGRAAHAGLEPEAGVSAVVELAHVIQALHALNEPSLGTTVNVGVVHGGTRANVVPARARASVDVRVLSEEEGARMESAIASLTPRTPGVTLTVTGAIMIPPLERTPRNRRLWDGARTVALEEFGLELGDVLAGGASDGNTASRHTATLDGLGCVGAGAHADHEHIVIDASLDRCALLARLLLMPA